ncbi:MAG: pgdA 6 [Bacillales bacterium]|jgi:polysaccharide deacetylase family protein (PEP-CTERM system associated)|nr:pgdA 6 [Bacillales bacterium]
MLNALTVDVEDWYHTSGLNIPKDKWDSLPSTVYENTIKLLNLFDTYSVKATFFILGDVARKYPSLIKEIVSRGHEIGCHSMNHRLVSKQTFEQFKEDFHECMDLLEELTGEKIKYYRAPSWSISKDKLSFLRYLEQNGVVIDSSLQPVKTPLSGINGIPLEPFKPILDNKKIELIEFPPTVFRINKKIAFPFAGGFYLRFFPIALIKYLFRIVNKTRPGMVYLHPWEFDTAITKYKTNFLVRFIQYYNLKSTEVKLKKLLDEFKFTSIGEVIKAQEVEYKEI